ncbi:MAG TPA: LamG domain-containing protein [Sedimentisphaerales bacterium]|jgi:hypothetical protein|nr:LamG domain-containing protein [Sedimentisphaerales bacterium]HNU28085.1 LamG domain-containing protein [Sedimentisphaerales bacterium]
MVLLIVMAVTILSAGFIARTDVELACGQSMLLRVQMDQLAHSGLEHAKGLLLCPQPLNVSYVESDDWYWVGDAGLQLITDTGGYKDFYDVTVVRDETDYCTYTVTSKAYRKDSDGDQIGWTGLIAQLRLDPCVGLRSNQDLTFRQNWVLHGDLYCTGSVVSQAPTASLDGDVFATSLTGTCVGQTYPTTDLSPEWLLGPYVTPAYQNYVYSTNTLTGGTTMSGDYPTTPTTNKYIFKCTSGDITLAAGTSIQGMLFVTTGNVTVAGSGCSITTVRNLPALYVGGDLVLTDASNLTIKGLAVVGGNLRIGSNVSNVRFLGGLYVAGDIIETTPDASANGLTATLVGDPQWQTTGALGGSLHLDGNSDYVDCGNNAALDLTTGITVAAWVQAERAGGATREPLVVKSATTYSLVINGSNVEFSVYVGSAPRVAQSAITTAFQGVWHHVAGTYDGSSVKLYIDGVPMATVAYAGSIASSPATSVRIGSDLADFYQGAIDDVHIYGRALSDVEMSQLAGGTSASDFVARWELDGPGSGVTVQVDPMAAAIINYLSSTLKRCWSPAAGVFIRSIERMQD